MNEFHDRQRSPAHGLHFWQAGSRSQPELSVSWELHHPSHKPSGSESRPSGRVTRAPKEEGTPMARPPSVKLRRCTEWLSERHAS